MIIKIVAMICLTAVAAAFNILGAMEMEGKHPELIDVPTREGKKKFSYYNSNDLDDTETEERIIEHEEVDNIAEKLQAAFKRLENKKSCLGCKHLRKEDDAYFCDAELTANVPQYCPSYEERED